MALSSCWLIFIPVYLCNASPVPASAIELVRTIENSASRDMSANEAGIFNWSPFSSHKHTDADLSIVAYRRPRLRGIGGLVKGRCSTRFAVSPSRARCLWSPSTGGRRGAPSQDNGAPT